MPFTVNFRFSGFRTSVFILLRQFYFLFLLYFILFYILYILFFPRGWFRRNVMNARGRHVGFLHHHVIAQMSLSSVTLCQSAGLSARRRWFRPRSIHLGYVVKGVALR